jgi:hypothetical protein
MAAINTVLFTFRTPASEIDVFSWASFLTAT